MTEAPPTDPWDDYAGGWDDESATNAYAAAAFSSLNKVLDARGVAMNNATVLDFGCGTGLLTERLAPIVVAVDAFDTSTAMREQLVAKLGRRQLGNVQVLADPPATAASYDLIVCSSVLAFVDSYEETATQLALLLRPNGLLVQWDWEFDGKADEPFGLTRERVTNGLGLAGLVEVEVAEAFAAEVEGTTMRPLMGIGQKQSEPTSRARMRR